MPVTDAGSVFIVDEFVAADRMLPMVATAILEANPAARVYGFALAKTG